MDTMRALVRVLPLLLVGCSFVTHFNDYGFDAKKKDAGGGDQVDAASRDSGTDATSGDAGVDATPSEVQCREDGDCDDHDPCNGAERCEQNMCQAGSAFVCEASADPCRDNVCQNQAGTATCTLVDAHQGESCAGDDVSTMQKSSCARDYKCDAGKCKAQTTAACHAGTCQVEAGCAAGSGCVYAPAPSSKSCDDGKRCTDGDHCAGDSNDCVGNAKNCDDSVGCTVDSCDESSGACQHAATDSLCSKACQVGSCDATTDCSYTPKADFTACDDGSSTTAPDFCYLGGCAGGNTSAPTASCALGGCNCSSYGSARDLEYYSGKYLALWSINQSANAPAACTTGEVSAVYEVTSSAFMPYSSDLQGGSVPGSASTLAAGFAIANASIGLIDTSAQSVDWSGNYMTNALSSGTPALIHYAGAAVQRLGSVVGGTTAFWVYGDDSNTTTTGRLVRCTWSNCSISPCSDPSPSCSYDFSLGATSYVGIAPYSQSGSGPLSPRTYAGVIAAVNFDSGTPTRRLYDDNTDKDSTPSHVARSDNEGTWTGLLNRFPNASLAYGGGTTNLVYCDDPEYDGTESCSSITGLPNQSSRAYYDAETTPSGGIVLLATSCTGLCISATYYLVVLPPGADARTGSNWQEYAIGSFGPGGTNTVPNRVAAGGTSIVVTGLKASAPYVQSFGVF